MSPSIKNLTFFRSCTLLVALAALSAAACSNTATTNEDALIRVVTTSNFVADWARNVGGSRVDVFTLVPVDTDPHTYQPGGQDVVRVAEADLILSVGLSLEGAWLAKLLENASAEESKLVALGDSVNPILVPEERGIGLADAAIDPHFWLDPLRVKLAVAEIAVRMSDLDPDGAVAYQEASSVYSDALDELHRWIQERVATLAEDRRLLVTSHDSLRYFADLYGFKIVGVGSPGIATRDPSAEEMAQLVDQIEDSEAPAIFVETTLSDKLARAIADETGATVVYGIRTGSLGEPDSNAASYIEMMRSNVQLIVESLQ